MPAILENSDARLGAGCTHTLKYTAGQDVGFCTADDMGRQGDPCVVIPTAQFICRGRELYDDPWVIMGCESSVLLPPE